MIPNKVIYYGIVVGVILNIFKEVPTLAHAFRVSTMM
jgi:hypothetical protein